MVVDSAPKGAFYSPMPILLAHFTGVPHHIEEAQSILGLWPIAVAIIEVSWLLLRRRAALITQAVRKFL